MNDKTIFEKETNCFHRHALTIIEIIFTDRDFTISFFFSNTKSGFSYHIQNCQYASDSSNPLDHKCVKIRIKNMYFQHEMYNVWYGITISWLNCTRKHRKGRIIMKYNTGKTALTVTSSSRSPALTVNCL